MDNMCKPEASKQVTDNIPITIEFQNLHYTVNNESKTILHAINGKFCSGEFTAILGPSGSGKTTLLNVLAGYGNGGVTGDVRVNGRPQNRKIFRKLSAYIMQESFLQSYLTVKEIMLVVAKLKLKPNINLDKKIITINEILQILDLMSCIDTRTECLSGGEKKRLSIALEMISNPSVLFLDEPTSGLDTYSIKKCITILQNLSKEGRTVICSVHQPSSTIFQQFDQVYFIANGMCIYNGSPSNLLPFLSSLNLHCPITHGVAEYLIETVHTDNEMISYLSAAIQNGTTNKKKTHSKRNGFQNLYHDSVTQFSDNKNDLAFPIPFRNQIFVLLGFMMLQMKRNKFAVGLQFLHPTLCGLFCGLFLYGIGSKASMIIANCKYMIIILVFVQYTFMLPNLLSFPSQLKLLEREYFNGWYGLTAYFFAITIRNLLPVIIIGFTFTSITYFLTGQPLELSRFLMVNTAAILAGVASESIGLIIGSLLSEMNGAILGPTIGAILTVIAIYGMGYGATIQMFMKIVMHVSYIRHAFSALMQAIFGNRKPLNCDEEFCYYKNPKYILRDFGITDSYCYSILALCLFCLLFKVFSYTALKYRLQSKFSDNTIIWFFKPRK